MNSPIHSRDAAALLARATLLPGASFSLGTAAAALGGRDALAAATAATSHLVATEQLTPIPDTSATGQDTTTPPSAPNSRYRWTAAPDTEARQLSVAEQEDTRQRVLDHLLAHLYGVAEHVDPGKWRPLKPQTLPMFDSEPAALAWFDAEVDALIAAQLAAFESGDLTRAWRFAVAAWSPLRVRRRHEDQLIVQGIAVQAARRAQPGVAELITPPPLARLSYAQLKLGQGDEALHTAMAAVSEADALGHAWSRSTALTARGRAHRAQGHLDLALADLVAALEIDQDRVVTGPDGQKTRPSTAIGLRWTDIADTQLATGDAEAAVQSARNAVTAIAEDSRRHREIVLAFTMLGRALTAAGQPREAIDELHEAAHLVDVDTNLGSLPRVQELIGDAHVALAEVEQAQRFYDSAIRLYEQSGRPGDAQALRTRLEHPSPATDDTSEPAG